MKRSLFSFVIISVALAFVLSSCSGPLFRNEEECLSFIKRKHYDAAYCPGFKSKPDGYHWLEWGNEYEGEMLNGKVKITILSFSDEEVTYKLDYKYYLMDEWTGPGNIGYGTEHHYDVSRMWRITKGNNNRPVSKKTSGKVHEYRDSHGPLKRIDTYYDE